MKILWHIYEIICDQVNFIALNWRKVENINGDFLQKMS